jgi:hypothetical protein
MKEILEKILTEKSARDPEVIEGLAAAQDDFSTWN